MPRSNLLPAYFDQKTKSRHDANPRQSSVHARIREETVSIGQLRIESKQVEVAAAAAAAAAVRFYALRMKSRKHTHTCVKPDARWTRRKISKYQELI